MKLNWIYYLGICIFGCLLFIPNLGAVHLFDWDEINFAECSREMLLTGDYFTVQINFQPFWEKPPLFFWLQSASFYFFGVNEFAARLPNSLAGIITLLLFFGIAKEYFKQTTLGFWWILIYAGSLLPHLYFKSGIIDPWFNLFIFYGAYAYYRYLASQFSAIHWLVIAAAAIGCAVLTKGPVGLLIFILSGLSFAIWTKNFKIIALKHIPIFTFVLTAVGSIWFANEILNGRWQVLADNIMYQIRLFKTQDAGHGGPFYYHAVVLLVGCFPASLFFIGGLNVKANNNSDAIGIFRKVMLCFFWVTLILFSIVKTKIVHYSSLCYFPLSFVAAVYINQLDTHSLKNRYWVAIGLAAIGVIIGLSLFLLPFAPHFIINYLGLDFIKDSFAREAIQAQVTWNGWEWSVGFLFIALALAMSYSVFTNKLQLIKGMLFSNSLVLGLLMWLIVPKIEPYSQGAAIHFLKSLQGKNCYVESIGFKSYAPYFYAKVAPGNRQESKIKNWLLYDKIDKDAYFVSKIKDKFYLSTLPDIELLYEKNGFVFWRRPAAIEATSDRE